MSTSLLLGQHLEPVLRDGGDLHLDLTQLRFIDGSGIRVVADACRKLRGRGRVVLRSPRSEVARLLDAIGAETWPNLVVEGT
jgi:anti-anti-sigma factor